MGARHFTGRADLLRSLVARYGEEAAAVDAAVERRLAELLGLHAQPDAQPPATHTAHEGQVEQAAAPAGLEAPAAQALPARRAPLRARWFTILHTEPLAEAESTPMSTVPRQALSAEDCAPRKQGAAPVTPLVVRTRLWPALHRALARPRLGRLDVPALVRTLSKVQTLHRLPRHKLRNWGSELVVVVDVAQRLIPYQADYVQLLAEVRRLHGRDGIVVWTVLESPKSTLAVQRGRTAHRAAPGPIVPPPPSTPVLILGDLGLLSGAPRLQQGWCDFCRRLAEAGVQPVAWLPCSGRLVTAEAARNVQVHSLGERDLRPLKRGKAVPYRPQAALEALLTRIACCVRVEPPLLRSLRRMAPDTADEPGLEALLWSHSPVVLAGARFCELAPAHQAEYRARFAALGAAAQAEILRRVLEAHAYRGRATESAEALIWQAHARAEAPVPALSAHVEAARDWFARLGEYHAAAPGDVVGYARDLFARHSGDEAWFSHNSRALATLWALTGNATIPAGLDSADIARARNPGTQIGEYELVQKGERLFVRPYREQRSAGDPDRPIPSSVPLPADSSFKPARTALAWPRLEIADGFEWSRADGSARHWLMPPPPGGELELPLGDDATATSYQLVAAASRYHFGLLSRPSWAPEWGRDREGLYALAPSTAAEPATLYWSDAPDSAPPRDWPPGPRAFRALAKTLPGGVRLGADLDHGLWLDVEVGGVTQRLRWIEPGKFLMGSSSGEPERFYQEGPRHLVRLTEGFWLADTACTQALWQAVVGNNPSRFKDDAQNPVETVSWDDVQSFLRKLEGILPGYAAGLPSEAQWEYACRAGSETAFSFGNVITPAQANYNGVHAYANGPTGEYRKETVPVKSFEPNAWGLYQMHGNVWEWCADGMRHYDFSAQVDPRGPEGDGAVRVVRGGSWIHEPGGLRCAYRVRRPRDNRIGSQGFRFSLRSIEPGGAERTAASDGGQPRNWLDKAISRILGNGGDATPPTKPERKR